MVNRIVQGYNTRKRTFFSLSRKKHNDVQKEMEEDLLAMQEVDKDACWKIYRLEDDNCRAHEVPNPKTKNCKQNPYCIHRLGLEKFDKLLQSKQKPEKLVRRLPTEPCGLVNFGNFCYVNSFLQIWFNDLQFRQCIYDWRASPDWLKPDQAKLDIQAVMDCLQKLFITMQFTPFDSTNANDFIQLLRLDNEQQDVQEFHTLFFGTIERDLQHHPNGGPVLEAIRRLFQSRIRQTIYCGQCHRTSITDGEYRSLQIGIDGHDSLISAIQHFFAPETLGDFRCDECGMKGWVSRRSSFVQLPEVLIIQLNRYVFDNTGRHKKLKTPIHYPRTLPIDVLTEDTHENDNYELCAVMIHEGQNTHCGHYYDIIRDPVSSQWYKYNDKDVIQEKRAPGYVVRPETFPRAAADTRGCYAIIYQRSVNNKTDKDLNLPPEDIVHEIQNKLDDEFSRQSIEGSRSVQIWTDRIENRNAFLRQLWKDLEVVNGRTFVEHPEDIVFLSTSLLTDLLSKEFKAVEEFKASDSEYAYIAEPVADLTVNLCKHGCVPLEAVKKGELKAVRVEAAKTLLDEYSVRINCIYPPESASSNEVTEQSVADLALNSGEGDPNGDTLNEKEANQDKHRLRNGTDICVECVEAVRKGVLFKNTLTRTEEHFSAILKKENLQDRSTEPSRLCPEPRLSPPEEAVWVSLSHLRSFKKLALRQMKENGEMGCEVEEEPSDKKSKEKELSEDGDIGNESVKKVKEEIICLGSTDAPSTSAGCSYSTLGQQTDFGLGPIWRASRDLEAQRSFDREFKRNDDDISMNEMINQIVDDEEEEENAKDEKMEGGDNRDELGGPSPSEDATNQDEDVSAQNGTATETISRFNDELLCKHNKLNPRVRRAWLTREEWAILSNNFFNCCDPISCNTPECEDCIEETQLLSEVKESSKKQLENLLGAMSHLLKGWRIRKCWRSEDLGSTLDHVLCQNFIADLQNAQKNLKSKNLPEIPRICQECLLCSLHNIPYIVLESNPSLLSSQFNEFMALDKKQSNSSLCLPITSAEWNDLVNIYKQKMPEYGEPHEILLQNNGQFMEFCDQCYYENIMLEEKKRFFYPEGAQIYIKLKGDESEDQLQAKAAASSSTATVTTRRVAASKDLIKIKMRSDETVSDLKLRLYEQTKQSPVDQLLYRNGQELDTQLTLEMAEVPSNNADCPLVLIVQQRTEDGVESVGANGTATRPLEKGFKDTALSA